MNFPRLSSLIVTFSALAWSGCHRMDGVEVKPAVGSAEAPNVTFKQGRGLLVSAPTLEALGIATGEAKERPVANSATVTVQVFDAGPPALASVAMASAEGESFAKRTPDGATFRRLDRAMEAGTNRVELIFALNGDTHAVGDFVDLSLNAPATNALAVPRAALIDGSSGSFVYVVNGDSFLRTMVKTGASDAEWMEITDGLYAGDFVVTHGAPKLWQAELRLIKGGADTN